ncbi:diguanylate cyclase/phosphodiesterase (GGDEF & EAL domains) with PAS/PAC sensor(s) [Pseudomonas fluorescens]|nr:diguanylate cyclase/phosphodiesterase (GGDEF & EAL domains) with PAS/PAC sensor(s) [Pseudomonas fluorescens]
MAIDLQTLYPKLIHLMLDTVFVVDESDHIVFVSDACKTLLGYLPDELIGTNITRYMHPEDLDATRASITRVMSGQPHFDFRNRYIRKDGAVVYILWAAFWSEEVGARIGVARNVTALAKAEEELRFLAHHDPLTKLTNRSLFNDRLISALRTAQRQGNELALLFLDINDFKSINDLHGHAAGDRVLCIVAQRLKSCVREIDTVARIGGDEFTVLLTDVTSRDAISQRLDQIHKVMSEPLPPEFAALTMPLCSIGVAYYPEHGKDADTLLTHSDSEMYRMKRYRNVGSLRQIKVD